MSWRAEDNEDEGPTWGNRSTNTWTTNKSHYGFGKAVGEREGSVALVHTNLGNRPQRTGLEFCKNIVGYSLEKEIIEIRNQVVLLQHKLAETYASLRYLL